MADTTDNPQAPTKDEQAILEHARKRFKLSNEAEDKVRAAMLEDKKFLAGEQWPEAIKKERSADGRPCLVIDRLTPQIKQVTNQQRAMRPAITVNPVAGGADPDTAEVLQGMVRHIESQSDADDAYDQAGRDQAEIGRGWIRVLTDYCDDKSFDQEIKIGRVRNPFTVFPDPSCQRRDYSDGLFLFAVSDLLVEDFKAKYPRAKFTTAAEFDEALGADTRYWLNGESIRVVEYWHVEITRTEVPNPAPGGKPRTAETRKIVCDTLTGLEILESYEWPGKYIPWVPVLGEEIDIEGKVDLRGMVRRAKDPQRMFNFWKSATTEMVALAPKAPFVAAEGQLEPYMSLWKTANTRNHPVLVYKNVTLGDRLAPPPQRQVAEPPIQALMVSSQAAEADLRAATGFFDVGERESREQSGRAIIARQKQGEHGNSDFIDGLARAVRHVGRIVIDLIPHYYDAPRVIRIVGLDNEPKTVMVHADNAPQPGPDGKPALPPGVEGVFDVSVGTYDVTVSTGPSFESARQEFVEQMAQIFQSQPNLFQVIGDLFFENMDIPNAKPIADRLKKLLPPQLQDQGAQDPAALQAQVAAMGQQIEQMGGALQQADQLIKGKQLELQAQQQIEAAKIQSQEAIKAAELASKEKIAAIQAAVDQHKATVDAQLGVLKLQAEQAKAAMQADRADRAQDAEHAHAAEMAERAAEHAKLNEAA